MPFEIRPIAVKTAITVLFIITAIDLYKGLPPYVCCKRAIAGSVIMYFITAYTVKAINAILINSVDSSNNETQSNKVNDAA
ncbi:MAG: hypothetical protein KAS23_08320 [Anaerohalosphaera sp.]|nr:hypothetical protein [Anaerohalosphaera sp.]